MKRKAQVNIETFANCTAKVYKSYAHQTLPGHASHVRLEMEYAG